MTISLEIHAGVATVTIQRPEVMNALDVPAKERLGALWREIAADDAVRAVILTGAGDRAFCAGSDIKEINRTGQMVTTEVLLDAIPGVGVRLDKPVIGALHGYCIGMGMTLALHCDLRLAAHNTVIGYPEVRHGMISAMSAMRLGEVIPQAYAMELLLMARNVNAMEAYRFGLLNAVVDDVQTTAAEWAERIASYPSIGVQTTKRLATFHRRVAYVAAKAEAAAARAAVEARDDYRQGAAAHESRR